ncbi:DUF1361 domain-containing protein [Paenibacillus sp. CAA11]|uniref:DUF1361 domain-containing protein n=1 Tax=Paenibacillus sp. CAA11 TaxID=1532905 RepID=UPI000D36BE15|nr:DUF1361 domain-containing protein [Paenibacillus sp. CAA11]AWB44119.1 DUF1361 domain-containing protein [Paenibacillus sp. CAA11]
MNFMKSLRPCGYPWKIYMLLLLLACTWGNLVMVYELESPYGNRPYLFIFWNMFLAWLPAVFMVLLDICYIAAKGLLRSILLLGFGAGWLFFYPNAAYLVTDLLHLFARFPYNRAERFWNEIPFWNHLIALLLAALIGLLLGTFTLYSVHQLVRRSYGTVAGWIFAFTVLGLSSFGIYMGRFVRWNTWDIVARPKMILRDLYELLALPGQRHQLVYFCFNLFVLTSILYLVVYLFTCLRAPLDREAGSDAILKRS